MGGIGRQMVVRPGEKGGARRSSNIPHSVLAVLISQIAYSSGRTCCTDGRKVILHPTRGELFVVIAFMRSSARIVEVGRINRGHAGGSRGGPHKFWSLPTTFARFAHRSPYPIRPVPAPASRPPSDSLRSSGHGSSRGG